MLTTKIVKNFIRTRAEWNFLNKSTYEQFISFYAPNSEDDTTNVVNLIQFLDLKKVSPKDDYH
jgi:hypothetical protein